MSKKLTKVVMKLQILDGKARRKAMEIAAALGVILVEMQGADQDLLVVIGEGLDPYKLTHLLRKKVGKADIVSVQQLQERRSYDPCPRTDQWQYPQNCPVNPTYQVVSYDCDDPSSCSIM